MIRKTDLLIRMILGHTRSDLRPMALSIAEAANLLFEQNLPWDELKITKDIYPTVAKQLNRKPTAVARSVERMANKIWDQMTEQQKIQYIGRALEDITSTTDMIVYLAYYVYWDMPYFEVMKLQYALS